MRWAIVGTSLLLAGCYQHAEYDVDPPVASQRLNTDVWVGLVTHTERGPQQNAFFEPLSAGDEVALVVKVPVPMYLYAVNIAPDGSQHVLTPGRQQRVDGMVRLPAHGYYTLVAPSGPEMLALIGSRTPVDVADSLGRRRLFDLVLETDARDDLAKLQSADPPGIVGGRHASMGIRAETLALESGGVRTKLRGSNVVVLFDIDHRSQ